MLKASFLYVSAGGAISVFTSPVGKYGNVFNDDASHKVYCIYADIALPTIVCQNVVELCVPDLNL